MGHFIEKIKPYRKSGFLIRYGVASLFGGHAVTHNDIAKNPIIRYLCLKTQSRVNPSLFYLKGAIYGDTQR